MFVDFVAVNILYWNKHTSLSHLPITNRSSSSRHYLLFFIVTGNKNFQALKHHYTINLCKTNFDVTLELQNLLFQVKILWFPYESLSIYFWSSVSLLTIWFISILVKLFNLIFFRTLEVKTVYFPENVSFLF